MYQVRSNDWEIDEKTLSGKVLEDFFEASSFENNGGDTLILFDKAKICHSRRVFGKDKKYKKVLNLEDLEKALKLLKEHKNKNYKEPPFGMYV
jgi:hypothetical protein